MAHPKLTKLELQIMEKLWSSGPCSIREIQEAFPESGRPAYTTVQTTVYRLEGKKAIRIVRRISNANIFDAVISRDEAQVRLIDDLLALFGGRTKPVMAHFVESGKLTLEDIKEVEQAILKLGKPKASETKTSGKDGKR
jgi:predicted transcriptional regulator